jgi:hypothetical protein
MSTAYMRPQIINQTYHGHRRTRATHPLVVGMSDSVRLLGIIRPEMAIPSRIQTSANPKTPS